MASQSVSPDMSSRIRIDKKGRNYDDREEAKLH